MKTHGESRTRLYKIWKKMIGRCRTKTDRAYDRYGGRGIKVCDEWSSNYESFRDWAYANGYSEDLTIDRIDNNGWYSPDNCRWTTYKVQNRNRRNNHYITYNGETKSIAEWAEIVGIPAGTLLFRVTHWWSIERSLTTSPRKHNRPMKYNIGGKEMSLSDWAIELGINKKTLESRIYTKHWPIEKALTTPIDKTKQHGRNKYEVA